MPRPVNSIRISGTVTADPRILLIENKGKELKIADFSIAFDHWNGKKLTPAWFFNCTSFAYNADNVEKYIKKGSRILITDGYISPNVYKTKDGTVKNIVKITVNDFLLIGSHKTNIYESQNGPSQIEQEIMDIDDIPL